MGQERFGAPLNPLMPLARLTGSYLSAIERSERNISIDNIARIAKGLKVEPWRLLRDD
jgi:transcriptional regulator with XRE-family HTH domain